MLKPLSDDPLTENPVDIKEEVALAYRRVCRSATVAGAAVSEYEPAAIEAAIRRHRQLDRTAPFNRHDAVAAVLEIVGNVIVNNPSWFWHGPDA